MLKNSILRIIFKPTLYCVCHNVPVHLQLEPLMSLALKDRQQHDVTHHAGPFSFLFHNMLLKIPEKCKSHTRSKEVKVSLLCTCCHSTVGVSNLILEIMFCGIWFNHLSGKGSCSCVCVCVWEDGWGMWQATESRHYRNRLVSVLTATILTPLPFPLLLFSSTWPN